MGPDSVAYHIFYVGAVCPPYVSDKELPGFSDGETIPYEGMSRMGEYGWDGLVGDWKNGDLVLTGKSRIEFEMKIDPRFFRKDF
jgi:hypothetical protein